MNEPLLDIAVWLSLIAMVWALCAWLVMSQQQRKRNLQQVLIRLQQGVSENDGPLLQESRRSGRIQRWMLQADMRLDRYLLTLLGTALCIAFVLLTVALSIWFGVLLLLLSACAAWLVWWRRFQKKRMAILSSLPGVMDAVVRGLDAGLTLEIALVKAFEDAPDVYTGLALRVKTAVEAGRDYAGAFDYFGDLYEVSPLHMVSIGLSTSRRFGASVRPILTQTADSLRDQEQLRREFMALTSETRFSAVVFAAVPILLGVGLITFTPTYRQTLLYTTSGHHMLMFSIGLLLIGIFWLYRMVQGVGHD